jgi:hypothetical protein
VSLVETVCNLSWNEWAKMEIRRVEEKALHAREVSFEVESVGHILAADSLHLPLVLSVLF